MKRQFICICVFIAFVIKLRDGFAPPVIAPGDMASGAMNDPFAVIVSAVMTAVVVWGLLVLGFRLISKIKKKIKK